MSDHNLLINVSITRYICRKGSMDGTTNGNGKTYGDFSSTAYKQSFIYNATWKPRFRRDKHTTSISRIII